MHAALPHMAAEPPAKRPRLVRDDGNADDNDDKPPRQDGLPRSLHQAISPPPSKKKGTAVRRVLPSPFRLTKIRDLPAHHNVDTVSLADILGDPLIDECWEFNYLHDLDFLMSHFDQDIQSFVKVHVVHGFWKKEHPNRMLLEEQKLRYSNVQLHTAYMAEMFGTHHSKMMIIFRRDDTAQVIIHTANMIAKDWTNMTNGAWLSPLLPLIASSPDVRNADDSDTDRLPKIGSGEKLKHDLLSYLRAYNSRRPVCRPLVEQLMRYDFSAARGALIASVPGRHEVDPDVDSTTRWGWAAVRHALRSIPVQESKKPSEIVAQISSVATLGSKETWLKETLLASFSSRSKKALPSLGYRIIFPTPDEVRRSLDGYDSGGSIHMKTQSVQQGKQLQYMRPMLCHWANDTEKGTLLPGELKDAGRQRAAPHIKTYIRYQKENDTIDWALLTSANISKQAWGEAADKAGDIKIASWEIGVMVWPELLTGDISANMVATFKTDVPTDTTGYDSDETVNASIVGLRIPYSLPLRTYGPTEEPWVATKGYNEPDWRGEIHEKWEQP